MEEIVIVTIGDIVGRPGRAIILDKLPGIREDYDPHLIIANGENIAGGSGLTRNLVQDLWNAGVDVITTGDHVYKKKEIYDDLETSDRIIRPENYAEEAIGKGFTKVDVERYTIGVLNLQGRVFMEPQDCPFKAATRALQELGDCTTIIVDFHAEATSEKVAMGWYLDGKVGAVVGTHTHIPTADARVLPGGTAYMSDMGMTGPYESVIGRDIGAVLHKFTTGLPKPFKVAKNDVWLCGAVITIDSSTGLATSIEPLKIKADPPPETATET